MQLVIVESPAKAKTIEKYLGKDFKVLASYGHVRDLPPKDGSVRPDEGFAMDWELYRDKQKRFKFHLHDTYTNTVHTLILNFEQVTGICDHVRLKSHGNGT